MVIWRGNVLRETIVLFSVIALLIALRQLVFYLSGITEVILQNDMRSRLFRFVLGRKLYAVKHQAEAGSGKPASDMLSGDISQRLERDLSSASSVVTDILPTIVVTLVQLFGAFFLMLNGIEFPTQHKPEKAATHIILENNLGDAGKIEYQLAKGYQQGDD